MSTERIAEEGPKVGKSPAETPSPEETPSPKEAPRPKAPRPRSVSSSPRARWVSSSPSLDIDTGELEPLPERYALREDEEGPILTCVEAPTLSVQITKGLTVPANSARKAAPGTIFLDGAAAGEPFMDVERRVYNLDHHEGCVRSFTLATCEQAMVLVHKGLDLGRGDWTVLANDPDLDTVLAIWVLLNHMRLGAEEGRVLSAIMPLVRLEGAIDAHGLQGRALTALPDDLLSHATEQMEALRREENDLKSSGLWSSTDYVEYTSRVLRAIDELVYDPRDFEGFQSVEELARVDLGGERVAVVCRSDSGIYEVEQALKRLHGSRVGLVLLQKEPGVYSVRLVDTFLPVKLDALYERLNLVDPAVRGGAARNRWGGSSEIGGSPRASGTALSPQRIARTVRWVYRPPSSLERARTTALASAGAVGVLGVWAIVAWLAGGAVTSVEGLAALPALVASPWLAALLLGLSLAGALAVGLRSPRRFGLRPPAGPAFLAYLPVTIGAGAASGSVLGRVAEGSGAVVVAAVLASIAAELLFRGGTHGLLVAEFRVQRAGGPWFLSTPTAVTTLLSTAATVILLALLVAGGHAEWWHLASGTLAAMVLGLACGAARERGESLLPPVLLHVAAALAAVLI